MNEVLLLFNAALKNELKTLLHLDQHESTRDENHRKNKSNNLLYITPSQAKLFLTAPFDAKQPCHYPAAGTSQANICHIA